MGTLSIASGTLHVGLTLFGNYVAAGFTTARDSGGGTAVTYTSVTGAHFEPAPGH